MRISYSIHHAYQIRSKSQESSVLHQQGEFNGEHDTNNMLPSQKKKKKNNMLQESKAQLFHHPLYLHAICAHSACEISKKSKNQLQEQMATKAGSLGNIYRRFKPQLLMVLAQIGYTFLYFITEASFNHGMNPHVYITYRHIVAGVVMFPFAYFLERYVYIFPFYIISVRR